MSAGASRLKQLIAVAQENSSEKRRDLLREITDVFMAAPDRYTSTEMQHFDVIMSRVTAEVETALRQEIAEKLADSPEAPKELMRQLARDEIVVAEPVLRRSAVLDEEDLISIVRQRGPEHMEAISKRRAVPERLTAELVERGNDAVLVSLAQNKGARFDDDTMTKMVGHARSIKDLQQPMVERYDIPPKLLTKMYFFVSSALKKEILQRSESLDPALIDEAVSANREKILENATQNAQTEVGKAHAFIAEKIRTNAVTEHLLKDLLERRQGAAFVIAFAHIVGVDVATAQGIVNDRSWESLAISARSAGLERATFAKIVFGLQRTDAEQAKALRILDLYLKIPQEAAERVMRFWRVRSQAEISKSNKAANPAIAMHDVGERLAKKRAAAEKDAVDAKAAAG